MPPLTPVNNQLSTLSTPPILVSLSATASVTDNISLQDLVKRAFSNPLNTQLSHPKQVHFNPILTTTLLIPSRTELQPYLHLLHYSSDEENNMRKNPIDPETRGLSEHQYHTWAEYRLTLDNTVANSELAVTHTTKITVDPTSLTLTARMPPNITTTRNLVWDSADSYHVTNDIKLLTNVHPIQPNSFAGISGSLSATHAGYLPFLPSINNMNVCYYSPNFSSTLLSLGYIHACGGHFRTTEEPKAIAVFATTNDNISLLDIAPHIPGSNTYLTSAHQLFNALNSLPHLRQKPTNTYEALTMCPSSLRAFIRNHPQSQENNPHLLAMPNQFEDLNKVNLLNSIPSDNAQPATNPPEPAGNTQPPQWQPKQLTKAQQNRVAEALLLHESQLHPPDAQLCHDLSSGKHPYSTLTPKDIQLMRDTLGPCIHCLAGRGNPADAIRLPSPSPPAPSPGHVISFDPQALPHPALGGFTQKVMMVDEFSGLISQPGAISKTTHALFDPMS